MFDWTYIYRSMQRPYGTPPPPPPPFSPSLISRTASVDVKHHVYLLTDRTDRAQERRWPSWDVRPNEPSGFRGRKAILNHASALVSACP